MSKYCECEKIVVQFEDHSHVIGMELGQFAGTVNIEGGSATKYESLEGIPSINGVLLRGNMTADDLKTVEQKTTSEWNANKSNVSTKGTIYVYTDYGKDSDGNNIPGIKIGDGKTSLGDLPFITGSIEISKSDIESWNSKWRGYIDESDPENLIFTNI